MIVDGQRVEAAVVNPAFMSRLVDTSTVGKVSLLNTASVNILDAQKFINLLAEFIGTIENDPLLKQYSSLNYLANGFSLKQCVEALDAALKQVSDDLVALDARESTNHSNQQASIVTLNSRVTELEDSDDHLNFKPAYAVAGEDILAGVYAVTFTENSSSQEGRVIKASNTYSLNKFNVSGILILSSDILEDEPFDRRSLFASGIVTLDDDTFLATDIGKPIYLGSYGELMMTPPAASGTVVVSLGTVTGKNSFNFNPKIIGVN